MKISARFIPCACRRLWWYAKKVLASFRCAFTNTRASYRGAFKKVLLIGYFKRQTIVVVWGMHSIPHSKKQGLWLRVTKMARIRFLLLSMKISETSLFAHTPLRLAESVEFSSGSFHTGHALGSRCRGWPNYSLLFHPKYLWFQILETRITRLSMPKSWGGEGSGSPVGCG